MAISFVGVGTFAASVSSPTTVPLPAGVAEDDLILLFLWSGEGWSQLTSASVSFQATGYKPLIEGARVGAGVGNVLAKRAGSSESNPSVSSGPSFVSGFYGFAVVYRGVSSDMIDVAALSVYGASTSPKPPDLTSVTDGAVMVSAVMQSPNGADMSLGTAQGFTLRAADSSTTGEHGSIAIADKTISSPASQTAPTFSSASSQEFLGVSLILRADGETSDTIQHRFTSPMRVGGGTTIVATLPDVAAGDLIAAHVTLRTSATVTPDTGFTLEASAESGTTIRSLLYQKVASGSETTVSFSVSTDSDSWAMTVAVFRGVDQSTPFDVTAETSAGSTSATFATPALTPVTAGTLGVSLAAAAVAGLETMTLDTAEGFVQTHDPTWWQSFYVTRRSAGLAVKPLPVAEATTFPTWTVAGSPTWAGISAALRPAPTVPAAPGNPGATATGATTIAVTWDDVANETGYRVERSADGSTGWADVSGALAADSTSWGDTGLTAGTTYFYRVMAFNTNGDSDPSSVVSATTDAGGDIFACLSAYDCLTADPFDCCCL